MEYSPKYILILFFVILVDYVAGLLIAESQGRKRKFYLVTSLIANVAILAVFKYYNFFMENVEALATAIHWNYSPQLLQMALPIGLSFHTFQSMSYTIEVYRGHQKPEKHLGIYALYVLFFPQLVAGPIERPQNVLHQFWQKHSFDYQRVTNGLKLMLWGFFMKVVIADRLAPVVNVYYDAPQNVPGPALALATICFALQIYCDFAGYSNIALGSAEVMGFKLMTNFNRPYSSRSIGEFWRRWHISLSTWFKDYVYVPMGGSRTSRPRHYFNLLFTFLLSGFWHGANWTFIVWGGLNGLYLIFGEWTKPFRKRIMDALHIKDGPLLAAWQKLCTFALISFAWIFFRATTMSEAFTVIRGLGHGWGELGKSLFQNRAADFLTVSGFDKMGWDLEEWFITAVALLILKAVHDVGKKRNFWDMVSARPVWVRWATYYALLYIVVVHGKYMLQEQFIYFRF
ncbi:MAG: hypothetical protein M3Q07_22635 [Pseudobdellovibrionaceae bacterium]|nr:hypothetical protein [Pseudobdellovibrionaceae bacterium]